MGLKFEEDRPPDCRFCYFWKPGKRRCSFGGEEHCYYLLLEDEAPAKRETMCNDCPYGRDTPCIGYCIEKIYKEHREKRKRLGLTGKEAGHAG